MERVGRRGWGGWGGGGVDSVHCRGSSDAKKIWGQGGLGLGQASDGRRADQLRGYEGLALIPDLIHTTKLNYTLKK